MKAVGTRFEDFVDWTSIISSKPTEKEEMSSLAVGFAAQMRKQTVGSEGEITPMFDGKWSKRSSLHEEAHKLMSAIISVDSLDRASNDQLVLEGAPNEAGTPLEEGIPDGGPSNVKKIGQEAPSRVAIAPML